MSEKPDEWEDDLPHTLIVEDYTDAEGLFCHIDHLPTCKWVDEEWNGEMCRFYQCAVAHNVDECGLIESLEYGGTALPHGPGEYQIKAWGRKYYVWDAGCYEYDGGLVLVSPTAKQSSSETVTVDEAKPAL